MSLEIKKGIPVPVNGKWLQTIKKMEVGDSVWGLTKKETGAFVYSMKYVHKGKKMVKTGRECVTRKQDDGTHAVWRTK